jgi:hypothetical protein
VLKKKEKKKEEVKRVSGVVQGGGVHVGKRRFTKSGMTTQKPSRRSLRPSWRKRDLWNQRQPPGWMKTRTGARAVLAEKEGGR